MPHKNSSYIYRHRLHPIFDMNMPEGYLFELLKKYISQLKNQMIYIGSIKALNMAIEELEIYIKKDSDFEEVSNKVKLIS